MINKLKIEKRDIATSVILTIITCGIYGLYWDYAMWDSLYTATDKPSNAGMDLFLSIATCGVYYIYMMYKMGKMENEAYAMYNLGHKDDSFVYLILSIFGFSIVAMAIMQSSINGRLADAFNNARKKLQ